MYLQIIVEGGGEGNESIKNPNQKHFRILNVEKESNPINDDLVCPDHFDRHFSTNLDNENFFD